METEQIGMLATFVAYLVILKGIGSAGNRLFSRTYTGFLTA
jgi:hypothetical protein